MFAARLPVIASTLSFGVNSEWLGSAGNMGMSLVNILNPGVEQNPPGVLKVASGRAKNIKTFG
jgi:hypothetical protein